MLDMSPPSDHVARCIVPTMTKSPHPSFPQYLPPRIEALNADEQSHQLITQKKLLPTAVRTSHIHVHARVSTSKKVPRQPSVANPAGRGSRRHDVRRRRNGRNGVRRGGPCNALLAISIVTGQGRAGLVRWWTWTGFLVLARGGSRNEDAVFFFAF